MSVVGWARSHGKESTRWFEEAWEIEQVHCGDGPLVIGVTRADIHPSGAYVIRLRGSPQRIPAACNACRRASHPGTSPVAAAITLLVGGIPCQQCPAHSPEEQPGAHSRTAVAHPDETPPLCFVRYGTSQFESVWCDSCSARSPGHIRALLYAHS
ncbi:hypothetical protein T440DRAFT_152980 [Plenodomus tracheiphilus IPT5]|uniref:Uncharacterized protein n=1 Tax=Plenodomus tracheiphilus IPT5 TaxID=1408161 RepID=A0A6A7BKU1_9PLEO|nr:hypothetical protein T440DRAFT_152980 [Plenodomus tracheiphilus IPT5]